MNLAIVDPYATTIFEGTTWPLLRHQSEKSVFDFPYKWIAVQERTSPEAQRMAHEIQAATGWSTRTMALALGVSHPTVGKLLDGRAASRLGIRQRLAAVHDVVSRIHDLLGHDATSTDRILRTRPEPNSMSPIDYLSIGNPTRAYLAAVDVIRPPRATGLMRGDWPTRPGEAASPLHE